MYIYWRIYIDIADDAKHRKSASISSAPAQPAYMINAVAMSRTVGDFNDKHIGGYSNIRSKPLTKQDRDKLLKNKKAPKANESPPTPSHINSKRLALIKKSQQQTKHKTNQLKQTQSQPQSPQRERRKKKRNKDPTRRKRVRVHKRSLNDVSSNPPRQKSTRSETQHLLSPATIQHLRRITSKAAEYLNVSIT